MKHNLQKAGGIPDQRNFVIHAFRRVLPGIGGVGPAAVVIAQHKTYVNFITHNDQRVEEHEYLYDDFCAQYHPDFTAGHAQEAAKELYACSQFLPVVPPARENLKKILSEPEEKYMSAKTHASKIVKQAAKKAAKPEAKPKFIPIVAVDHQRRTMIVFERDEDVVRYIPLEIDGFDVKVIAVEEFDRWWKPLVSYPTERAAKLYASYAANLGATEAALKVLSSLTTLTQKEIEMATAKKAAKAATKSDAAKKAAANSKTGKAAKPAKEAKAAKTPAAPKEKKPTASAMFCDLIMAGGKTDDQIFKEVQKKFQLSDDKRSYVKWYRNKLTKDGKKPPAAKEAK